MYAFYREQEAFDNNNKRNVMNSQNFKKTKNSAKLYAVLAFVAAVSTTFGFINDNTLAIVLNVGLFIVFSVLAAVFFNDVRNESKKS